MHEIWRLKVKHSEICGETRGTCCSHIGRLISGSPWIDIPPASIRSSFSLWDCRSGVCTASWWRAPTPSSKQQCHRGWSCWETSPYSSLSLPLHHSLSILKEINPEYSLEGLMLKFQSFGHLMGRVDSLEKTLMLERLKIGVERDDMVGCYHWLPGDEMVGWLHRFNRHESEQALGGGKWQGSLACCSLWGRKWWEHDWVAEKQQHHKHLALPASLQTCGNFGPAPGIWKW